MLGGKCADLSRPVIRALSHQRAVAGIRIGVELIQALYQPGPQRVQMDAAQQLQQVGLLPAEDGLVAVNDLTQTEIVVNLQKNAIGTH